MRKKKILFHSNHCKAFTGFGKNSKNILKYLYNTGKYDLVELANGMAYSNPQLKKLPWPCYGSVPDDPAVQKEWNKDPGRARSMGYGAAIIDKIIREEKPDIYIGVEDIWAFNGFYNKPWWDKINSMVWTTLDSLPILPDAVKNAPKIKHYYVWATFAERALHKLGHEHVKTLRGSLDTDIFLPLPAQDKKDLKAQFNLSNSFVIGFVFRNQLRKSVPNLLDGFKIFNSKHPDSNTKLLLHTSWGEGWDIPRLLEEKDIPLDSILTTYFCAHCNSYEIKPFEGNSQNCPFCGGKGTHSTTNVNRGVSEEQLNEIYNLMDVYCHPFTSGGQEIPVQEAKLTELITLVTNYSCGEDSCTTESGGVPLRWAEYREPGTQFIKASTDKEDIARQLSKIYRMPVEKKRKMEKRARKWVIDNFSIPVIGKKIENLADSLPLCKWDFEFTEPARHPEYLPPTIPDNSAWLIDIYKNILLMEVDENDNGHQHWIHQLNEGLSREQILNFFRETARKENMHIKGDNKISLQGLIDDKKDKRLVIVMPGTLGDVYMTTALLPSLSKTYPEYALYFATQPQYFDVLNGNPHIYKVIPYHQQMDDLLFLEGAGDHPGFFDIAFLPTIGTQKVFNYQHNAEDRIQFDLCTS